MPIDGGRSRVYVLGRECKLSINDREITGAADVSVRETVQEVDATAYNAPVSASLVTMRTFEVAFLCPDIADARYVFGLREAPEPWVRGDKAGTFFSPNIVGVTLEGGLIRLVNRKFTIQEVDADEPLDGVVVPRFVLREWFGSGYSPAAGTTGTTGP